MAYREILRGATGIAVLMALAGPAGAVGDPAAGEKAYKAKCSACHSIADDKNKIGPTLKGVYDRKAGEVANFKYSDAMKASGVVWNEANIAAYLKDPKGFVAGNKMTFVGIKDDKQIADIIAYIKQSSGK
jgi:cytochrome c